MKEQIRHIKPAARTLDLGLAEVWSQRELLAWFGWRDIAIRYRQTIGGWIWAVAQPVAMMVLFTVTLGFLARVPSNELPYAVLVLSGLVPWILFSATLTATSGSLVGNAALITKVYFSRSVIVLGSAVAPFVDYLIALVILVIVLAFFGILPVATALLLPVFGALILATAIGPGLWFATLNVRYRDVRFIVPFLLQVGMFGSPIVYPISLVPAAYLDIYALNPATFLIEGFRYLLFGKAMLTWTMAIAWFVFTVVSLATGLLYLRWEEKSFADSI